MIILDTNVVSELLLVLPNPLVLQWIEKQSPRLVHATAVTEANCGWVLGSCPSASEKLTLQS